MAIITLNNNSLSGVTALPAGVGGKVLQVQQNTFTTKFTQTINGNTPATLNNGSSDIGVSITPSSASNKILVSFNIGRITAHNSGAGWGLAFGIQRNGSLISQAINTDGGNTPSYTWFAGTEEIVYDTEGTSFQFLDSPVSTSQQTYTLKTISHSSSNYIVTINGWHSTPSGTNQGYQAGTITMVQAMEIA
jgi:hypothetical protein